MKQTSILRLWFLVVSVIVAIFVVSSLRSYALPALYEEETFLFGESDPFTESGDGDEEETDPIEDEGDGEEEEPDPTGEDSSGGEGDTEPTDETIPTAGEETEPTEPTQSVDETVVPFLNNINLSLLLIIEIIKIAIACAFIWFFILKPLRHFVF